MKLDPLHARSRSAAASGARLSVIGLAALFACTTSDAVRAATPASCESLTNFRHPDTTINSAQSYRASTSSKGYRRNLSSPLSLRRRPAEPRT